MEQKLLMKEEEIDRLKVSSSCRDIDFSKKLEESKNKQVQLEHDLEKRELEIKELIDTNQSSSNELKKKQALLEQEAELSKRAHEDLIE